MIEKGLFDYLDRKEAVDIEQKGGVKIAVTTLYADGVQDLITRLLENEGFEELKNCANNLFFVNSDRLQILQIEFIGCSKRFEKIECGGVPVFKVTLIEFQVTEDRGQTTEDRRQRIE